MQMDFPQAIASGFKKYVDFSGRASRSEYWYWVLFTILAAVAASILDAIIFRTDVLNPIFSLATLIPTIAVTIRRLHDVNHAGWWFLIYFTVIGAILLLVWFCTKGTDGANAYGPDPLGVGAKAADVFS
jgi:uncharacterized membrane protein YhaH (DUF805 family)